MKPKSKISKKSSLLKILTLPRLILARRRWAKEGRAVVFTNGVFDILHAGHMELLEKAASLGDALIVGVNSDASARRLHKGPGRPIQPLKDRARILAGLACVDAVIPFGEDTPERLLSFIKPEVLVKGADYRPGQVAGRRHAGRVALLPLKLGRSTTAIIERIRTRS